MCGDEDVHGLADVVRMNHGSYRSACPKEVHIRTLLSLDAQSAFRTVHTSVLRSYALPGCFVVSSKYDVDLCIFFRYSPFARMLRVGDIHSKRPVDQGGRCFTELQRKAGSHSIQFLSRILYRNDLLLHPVWAIFKFTYEFDYRCVCAFWGQI